MSLARNEGGTERAVIAAFVGNFVLARLSTRDDLTGAEVERLLVAIRASIRERHPEVLESFLEVNPDRATADAASA